MARIELRNTTIKLKDGLAGTAAINEVSPAATDTDLDVDTIVLNSDTTDLIPVGARFLVAGETDATQVHVVTARTPTGAGPTTNIVFTPALGPGTYADDGVITFQSQELEVKIGEGELNYTETDEYNYDLDRGNLDTVRQGDEQPMDVSISATYEHITTGTGETIAFMDAIKRRSAASEWVNSATDKCEPYAVDIEVVHTPPCGTDEPETTTFPDFRSESREVSFNDSLITVSGRCNATEPIVSRG